MKNIFLALFMAVITIPAIAAEQAHALKPIEAKYVCMVNNTAFEKEQIAVEVDGKTYYGCCPMCEERLKKDIALRSAIDPVSGQPVDKAGAVIGADANGKIYYFESSVNLEKYETKSNAHHSEMMKGDMKEMHHQMINSDTDSADLTKGTGVLHDINVEEKKINITHAPIPSLRWPEMTMDLPVSDNVDLSNFSADDQVKFFLKLEDKTYIIEKMEVMKKDAEHDHKHEMKKEDHSQHHHEDDHSNHH